MDLAQKPHLEPNLRVAEKPVLPQSIAGCQGRCRGCHMSYLCPKAKAEGPTLPLPMTPGQEGAL